jgi:ankyrin repeat protein
MRFGVIFLAISILLTSCAKAGCDANTDPSTPLNMAIKSLVGGNPEPAIKLLESGMSPNQQNECGASLLHISIIAGKDELALRLIQMGADGNLTNWQNETPVFMAANWSRNEVLKKLLLKNGNPNHQVNERSPFNTPLLIATTNGNTSGVQLLLKHGANPYHKNHKGQTALDIAKSDGYNQIIELLNK